MTWKDEQEAEINRDREEEEEEEDTARWLWTSSSGGGVWRPLTRTLDSGSGAASHGQRRRRPKPSLVTAKCPALQRPRTAAERDIISVVSPAISESCRPCLSRGGRAGGQAGGHLSFCGRLNEILAGFFFSLFSWGLAIKSGTKEAAAANVI